MVVGGLVSLGLTFGTPTTLAYAWSTPAATDLQVTGPNGIQPTGSTLTYTALAQGNGGTPEYEFWTETSDGSWHIVQPWSTDNTLTMPNVGPGSYPVVVQALDAGQIAAGEWTMALAQTFIVNVGSSVTITGVTPADATVGKAVSLTAQAHNLIQPVYQWWIETPGGVWRSLGNYGPGTAQFTPTVSGTYHVVVYAKDPIAPNNATFSVAAETVLTVSGSSGSNALLTAWGITGSSAPTPPSQLTALPNQATSASAWWSNANPSLIINALTPSGPINQSQPGDTIQLIAEWAHGASTPNGQPTWQVDSPDGFISPATGSYSYQTPEPSPGNDVVSQAVDFTASQPGIYVVQATWDGVASIPLVIPVGAGQLASPAFSPDAAAAGVLPVPASSLTADAEDSAAVQQGQEYSGLTMPSIWIGQPIDGWIPVAGQIPSSWMVAGYSQSVQIQLSSGSGSSSAWKSYVLPVDANGRFSGIVASPYAGQVQLELTPANLTTNLAIFPQATANQPYWWTDIDVSASVALNLSETASAALDYTNPSFAAALQTAATLWANAPDPESGLAAISNWVATHVAYDYNELTALDNGEAQAVGTASEVYQTETGVCQDYADLLAAMYRGLGIPAVVEQGVASNTAVTDWTSALVNQLEATDGHAWVVVNGIGSTPWITDPTWDGGSPASLSQAQYLTNAYTLDTPWFQVSHYDLGPETWLPIQ